MPENPPTQKEKSITLRLSRFLHYALGNLPSAPIAKEEAQLLEILQIDTLYIQWNDIDTGKPLKLPILWLLAKWREDEKHRAELRRQHEIHKKAVAKLHESVENLARVLSKRTGFSVDQMLWTAAQIIQRGDLEMVKQFGVELPERTEEEIRALDYKTFTSYKYERKGK